MSHILFIRLAGPMQSWGVMSRFSRRDTGREPSKSGVIGLISAAMGISRDDADVETNPTFAALSRMKIGIRVLRGGVLQSDYHTAQNIAKADGGIKNTELSTRFYLADADFIVALQSDDRDLLEQIHASLKAPKWQLFLGRKSFVPHLPVYLSDAAEIVEGDDLQAVLEAPDLLERISKLKPWKAFDTDQRLVIEDAAEGSEIRQDVPLSFARRQFTVRRVRTAFVTPPTIGGEENGAIS